MQYILEIELKSAVCPGSGEGWAGLIDSDIVFDDLGIPFIPARRIKGILRENAYDIAHGIRDGSINPDTVKILFGDRGKINSSPLVVGDARPPNYQQIRRWLLWAKNSMPHLVTGDRVIHTFTSLRQQTAIDDDGVAMAHSLRTTRVLNAGKKYYAEIELQKNEFEPLLALSVQVFRHLGGKRNRGLGKVACRLWDTAQKNNIIEQHLKTIERQILAGGEQ